MVLIKAKTKSCCRTAVHARDERGRAIQTVDQLAAEHRAIECHLSQACVHGVMNTANLQQRWSTLKDVISSAKSRVCLAGHSCPVSEDVEEGVVYK
eukprot:1161365-Pelagomonas_calceolata.AAC.10